MIFRAVFGKNKFLRISFLLKIICACIILNASQSKAQFLQSKSGNITFFSEAPIENIEASSNSVIALINAENGEIAIKVFLRSFEFEKALMQEHFNENYVESDKYPSASFKGEILDFKGLSKLQKKEFSIKGVLDLHGIKKERMVIAKLVKLNNGNFQLQSKFKIACKDHDIKIPKILWKNIAEEIEVSLVIPLKPKEL